MLHRIIKRYTLVDIRFIMLGAWFFFITTKTFSQDSIFIKVHFLYGSKPAKKYKYVEKKWFGGLLGGHVGIETDSSKVLNFVPRGEFHYFAKKRNPHSRFVIHQADLFWEIFGGKSKDVKKLTVIIPLTFQQKNKLDSIYNAYTKQTPYDYAFFGMRCGSAAYDILGKLGVLKEYSYKKTYLKIFYPRKLRRRLVKKAKKKKWEMIRQEGSSRRKWEHD